MRKIELEASGFSGVYNSLNGIRSIQFNSLDLIRANACIGYSSWRSILLRSPREYLESIYHSVGTIAYTKTENGNLALADNFYNLDTSEKNPITYRLGMAITKLVAERELNIPWLLHVDRLVELGIATITTGTKERGDLAGLDIDNIWHVLESKGRSNKPSSTDINMVKTKRDELLQLMVFRQQQKVYVCLIYINQIHIQDLLTHRLEKICIQQRGK